MFCHNLEETFAGGGSDPLYSQVQVFFVKNHSGEERQRELRIVVDAGSSLSKVSSKHLLTVQVSDDEDPFFYFSLVLTDDDYQRLKVMQGLLVDFETFPSQLCRLLEQCKENDSTRAKFLLLLEDELTSGFVQTCLKIVETNNFKHLCHLTLKMQAGNDEDIKKLMLKKIKCLKEQASKFEKISLNLESQLKCKTKLLETAERELEESTIKWREEALALKSDASKALSEENEKLRKAQLEWQIRSQRERVELEERFNQSTKERDGEIAKLRLENQILLEKRSHSDTAITEQARRIDSLEKEASSLRSELSHARKHSTKLDAEHHEKERLISSLKTRLAVAEQEAKDKTVLLGKQQELLNVANEQKKHLEDLVAEKERQIQRKLASVQSVTEELVKANEIIAKLQNELTLANSKLKVRTSIALEQEKVVETHLKTIGQLQEDLLAKNHKISELAENASKLKEDILELKETIDIKEKKIKDNEKIIDWLNRRTTEQQVSRNKDPATSTPFTRLPAFAASASAVSATNGSVKTNLSTLDRVETPSVIEETPPKKPAAVRTDGSTKSVAGRRQGKNGAKTVGGVGFRRLSPTEPTFGVGEPVSNFFHK